ncbi:MAG: aldehyde dehydrogenase family protein, partial [Candidatus Xenobia bacterium]
MTVAAGAQYQMTIGGELVGSRSGKTMAVINPATGQTLAQVPAGGAEDVKAAVAAASKAFPAWSSLSPGERAAALLKLADVLEKNASDL